MASTVGGELQQARKDADVSLESIAQRTKIRRQFLEAIEANDFDRLPDGVVRRGHLRAYAREVGLDPEKIVSRYLREQELRRPPAVTAESETDRLQLETRHTQIRRLLLAVETAYHRAGRAVLRALQRARLPQ